MSLSTEKAGRAKKAFDAFRTKARDHPAEDERDGEERSSRKTKSAHRAKKIFTKWTTTAAWHNCGENDKHLLVTNECKPECTKEKDKKVAFVEGISTGNKKCIGKKSKKGWKRIRHAALMACRYIGMGVSQLSPATTYSSPDYYADPYSWCNPYDINYNSCRSQSHWTTGLFLNGW